MAQTIEYVFQKLSGLARSQSRIRQELRLCLPCEASAATYQNIDSLPFLDAIILESLRTIASIETYQPRVVPPGGCTIEGCYLPQGTIISSQPYLMNYHPEIFHRPFDFKPERWLLPMKEYNSLKFHLWTISSGPQACIGRHLAMASKCCFLTARKASKVRICMG